MFSVAKSNLERLLQKETEPLDQLSFNKLVREAFRNIKQKAVIGITRSNRATISKYLF